MSTSQIIKSTAGRAARAVKAAAPALAAAWLILGLPANAAAAQAPASPLKALIVTGQNASHDWKVSTAALKQMLEDTGLFQVDVAESPAAGAKMDGFEPRFAAYKLVVLNYYGDIWPPSTRRAFSAYVKNGGGVVVYHAASIAFAGWPEYNDIIGLGGWANRNESFGPYVFWKDGAVVRDPEPGAAGYHPRPFVFPVVTRDATHPITAGLPATWMHAEDELYSLLRGPAKNLTVLATARSGFEHGGTGRDEPVLFTVTYGAGRVFHTVLGHAADAHPPGLECAGFIVTFQRGAEWAATGKVTQRVPPDFPASNRDTSTPEDVRLWPGFRPPTLEPILKDLATFEYSRDEAVLYRLRDYVLAHNKSEEARAGCEEEILAGLGSATQPYAILALCRSLRLIGSEKSVPALEKLLLREETADSARYALEKIQGAAADAALLRALDAAQGSIKTGIVSSLGGRKTAEAVKPLASLISGPDAALARAAVVSLGRIGGAEGAAALAEAFGRAVGDLKTELAYALLGPIEEGLAARDFPAALALADKILAVPPAEMPQSVRQAAFKAKLMSLEKPEAARLVLDTLARGPEDLRQPAIAQAARLYSETEIGPLAALLPKLPEAGQIQLIAVLSDYPKAVALAPVAEALKSEAKPVRLAALKALAKFSEVSNVTLLAQLAAKSRGEEQAAARQSLASMPGKDIDEAILFQLLSSPKDELKSELIRATGERRILAGKGLLMEAARSGTPANAAQAARALRPIAEPADIPALLDILLETGDESAQDQMRTTIGAVAQQAPDPYSRANAVKRLLVPPAGNAAGPELNVRQLSLLYLALGNIGDNSTLPLLRAALDSETADIHDAAVRALSAWPSAAALEDCLGIAQGAQNLIHKVLALRGFVRMVTLDKYQSPQSALRSLKTALDLSTRPDEKKLVLGALPDFPSAEALALAESLLTAEGVQAEAQAAADKIKEKLEKQD
jgi:uncharacterized protein